MKRFILTDSKQNPGNDAILNAVFVMILYFEDGSFIRFLVQKGCLPRLKEDKIVLSS